MQNKQICPLRDCSSEALPLSSCIDVKLLQHNYGIPKLYFLSFSVLPSLSTSISPFFLFNETINLLYASSKNDLGKPLLVNNFCKLLTSLLNKVSDEHTCLAVLSKQRISPTLTKLNTIAVKLNKKNGEIDVDNEGSTENDRKYNFGIPYVGVASCQYKKKVVELLKNSLDGRVVKALVSENLMNACHIHKSSGSKRSNDRLSRRINSVDWVVCWPTEN